MSDEFDIVHLNDEQVQDIINWSVQVGAIMVLLGNLPPITDESLVNDVVETLQAHQEGISSILVNMPDVLRGPAVVTAREYHEIVVKEEEQVAEFIEELKDL